MGKVRVAVIGLGFGGEFVPIYQKYNDAECIAVCRRNKQMLDEFTSRFHIEKGYDDYQDLLRDPDIDAVHINSDLGNHGWMAIEALKAGKHVASTVAMSLKQEECEEIVRLESETGKVYMMMETALYTREYLYVKKMRDEGKFGDIQFVRSDHMQNMALDGWPAYWQGFPPFLNGTHALSPIISILNKRPKSVIAHGSGRLSEKRAGNHGCPFAAITATFTFEDSYVTGESTRWINETIRQCREGFDVYGTEASFEWELEIDGGHVIHTGI
ncbi:MAG: Gfo/Idh/MocA family oxidoreductase, partial [Clostridia bacterium]|nr:Gfo/Idh/MocA family oxidoreductase [Clostridia bacterium]